MYVNVKNLNLAKIYVAKIIPFIIIFIVGFLWLNAWIEHVNPFPDRDAINQFYFPFLNYLQASKFIIATPGFLTDVCFSGSYPFGSAIFPWLISVLGLQDYFINNPFQLYSILLFPIACIPYYFDINNRSRILLGLLILALPITQISLKGFSLHSFNVFFALIAVLSFRSYLIRKEFKCLLIFIICFWIAVICKHLGAFYLVNFVFAYLLWSLIYLRSINQKIVIAFIVIIAISIPFYPMAKLNAYLAGIITHNPHISLEFFFTACLLILTITSFILLLLKKFSLATNKPILHKGPSLTLLLLLFATTLCMIPYDAYTGNTHVIIFFIVGYSLIAWFLMKHNVANTRGFIYLFSAITFVNSTLLYCSLIGKTYYIFFLPISLIAILEFLDTKSAVKRCLTLVIAVILSNFFPSIEYLHKLIGDRGEDIYVNAFNSIYVNPLGWEICEIPELRKAMAKIVSRLEMDKNTDFYIADNMHFQTKLSLEFPDNFFFSFDSIYRLDNLPKDKLIELYNEYKRHKKQLFAQWVDQKKIPFLLIGKKPFIQNVESPTSLEQLLKLESFELRSFAKSLGSEYINSLKQNQTFDELYRCTALPQTKSRLRICTLLSSNTNNVASIVWNQYLIKIATDYEMEQTRPLPEWIENLDMKSKIRLREKRAGTLYGQLELELDSIGLNTKRNQLLRILELDPNHVGATHDLKALKIELNNERRIKLQTLTPNLSSPAKSFELFRRANDAMDKKNWREAKSLLEAGLKLEPKHSEMLKDLAIVNAELQHLKSKQP